MKGNYWYCYIGPADVKKYKGNGADFPLRQAVRNVFNKIFGEDYVCSSGFGISEDQTEQISFATYDDKSKLQIIESYIQEKKKLPRYMRAWQLLFKEDGRKK